MLPRLNIGVDVGTGSVRAGVFQADDVRRRRFMAIAGHHTADELTDIFRQGAMIGRGEQQIKVHRPKGHAVMYQQFSEDVYGAVRVAICEAVTNTAPRLDCAREAVVEAIAALSFDATCSMVVLGDDGTPLDVSPEGAAPDGDLVSNIVLWLDHRAVEQAKAVNATGHRLLEAYGGRISPEHEIPKTVWIKQHLPAVWARARKFFDLADYLCYRCTGQDVRSATCVTAKWAYDLTPTAGGWDRSFLECIGLQDLEEGQIGTRVAAPGESLGPLRPEVAAELGLSPDTIVAVGTVDAMAGCVGSLGVDLGPLGGADLQERMAVIAGTSTCHLALTKQRLLVPGVWGPFYEGVCSGYYLLEGGMSVTGALLDHIISTHPAAVELRNVALSTKQNAHEVLIRLIEDQAVAASPLLPSQSAVLARRIHVSPHFAGCRSPLADPELRGAVVGLDMDTSLQSLAVLYLATVQALAYGTKHIIDTMVEAGHVPIKYLLLTGGLSKNRLFVREHADATGCTCVLPQSDEGVLLGTAMLASVACKAHASVVQAMSAMSRVGSVVKPSQDPVVRSYHACKYKSYIQLGRLQQQLRDDMQRGLAGRINST